ncbi:acetylcholine receptor subunit beta-like 1-like [Elysia marginata]|uniref:Acetylcholine receptor subunit beta-like 1-like n=1 Tax=Elysia marginata TaxID=1093978 RepID=A0AAV4HHC0_9GAST|nr:acetylcholine receptor subunit beta-like 1-like [Elysia marginata]
MLLAYLRHKFRNLRHNERITNHPRLPSCRLHISVCAIAEQNLNDALFKESNYNPLIRPVINSSESLNVNFSLALSAIIDVDEKNQVMVTNVWLQMYWFDYQLRWNPAEYHGIQGIKINHTFLWKPEIVLFNNADGNFEPSYHPNCVLSYTGQVDFIPPAIYTSSCTINVEYFPFDQQVCEMKFGSWTFESKTLVYTFHKDVNYLILSDFMKNGAWDIVDCPGEIETITDTVTREDKEIIVYKLMLRRKTLFYTVNLIIPCFLHAFSCLWVFLLPADGCEKVTLVISVLVSLVVLLLVLQKILPPSKTIPLIAKYFIFTFIMNVFEISVSIAVVYCGYKGPRTADVMPKWICWLFLYKLPKYLLMERPDHETRWQQKSCTPPPSYPNTPMVPRANLAAQAAVALSAVSTVSAAVTADIVRQRKPKSSSHGTPKTTEPSKETMRVQDLRHKFSKAHSPGVTMSSSTSGSHISDESPTMELSEFPPPPPPLKPLNGHRCMLRDSGTSQSSESIDCLPSCSKRLPEHHHRSLPRDARSMAVGRTASGGIGSEHGGPPRSDGSSSLGSKSLQRPQPGSRGLQPQQQLLLQQQLLQQQQQLQGHHQQQRQTQVPQFVLTKEIYSAANAIKYICHQLQNREDYDTVIDDWKYLAAVIDRLLMIIFVLVSLSGSLGVLMNAPYILETVDQDAVIEAYSPPP